MIKQRCYAAALAFVLLILGLVGAEATAAETVVSTYVNESASPPEVPACAPVDSAYFERVAFVGDSMGDGLAIHDVLPGLPLLAKIGLSPRAAQSDALFEIGGVPVSLADKLTAMRPEAVYLWLGSNGLVAMGVDQIIADYDQLLSQLLEALPGIPFYLLEVTPVRVLDTQADFTDLRNERIDEFNAKLRDMAKLHGLYVLPVNALLRDADDMLGEAYAAKDGSHLLREAYETLADYLSTHVLPVP